MALYWPAFDFAYRLDVPRLLPHIAAIEACREAASTRFLPPPWRQQSLPAEADDASSLVDAEQINLRKEQLRNTNAGRSQAWVKQRFAPGSSPISLEDILTMHRMAAEDSGLRYKDPGTLRDSGFQVFVGRREVGGFHVGAPQQRLPDLMARYVQFLHKEVLLSLPPVIHSLIAHFFFTTIHPFEDGNGRVSRLVSAGILFQRGYNGHGLYAMQNHFYQRDFKYHTLLHQCWQQEAPFDLTEFVGFGMEGLLTELQGINSFVKIKLHRGAERSLDFGDDEIPDGQLD
jgi:Fic family protein